MAKAKHKEPKFAYPWYSMEGEQAISAMDDKNLMSFVITIGELLIVAWPHEERRVTEPLAVNVPRPYINYLPKRYMLAPEVYWLARTELKHRGLM